MKIHIGIISKIGIWLYLILALVIWPLIILAAGIFLSMSFLDANRHYWITWNDISEKLK